jgi:hypothetical protein
MGLPTTKAGTPFIPNEVGLGWFLLENDAQTELEICKHIGLLFCN